MRTIWKYTLQLIDEQTWSMPAGARLLAVQTQGGQLLPQLWAEVDPARPLVARRLLILGTGHLVPASKLAEAVYVGTFQLQGGALVFHLYDAGEGP